MGGGASHGSIEGLLATTMMVGRALAGIYRNPGMYRIQDFHSPLAPRLKSAKQQQVPFAGMFGEEDDGEEDDYQEPDPILYEHLFHVTVNDEVIYLDDACAPNEAGWTPLHACCMSFHTATVGIQIITEMARRGENLDSETTAGPGTFNKGWSALHMACAYNVEPLVEALLHAGASPNGMNSFGYSPLLEACHRGYMGVVELLLKGGASISHVPPDDLSSMSPFAAAPAHAALGESSRCGFVKIVELLLDQGAEKDVVNSLGWTPLHEAAFYNRRDVVAVLMDAGSDATLRTNSGALAFHLSGLEEVRSLIEAKGGSKAVPEDGDTVNMLDILHEITVGAAGGGQQGEGNQLLSGGSGAQAMFQVHYMQSDDEEDEDTDDEEEEMMRLMRLMSQGDSADYRGGHGEHMVEPSDAKMLDDIYGDAPGEDNDGTTAELVARVLREAEERAEAENYEGGADSKATPVKGGHGAGAQPGNPLLHSGPMLGNLPSLAGTSSPEHAVQRSGNDLEAAMREKKHILGGEKKKKKKKGKKLAGQQQGQQGATGDVPPQFMCMLSQQPMQDPVKSVYGHVYEHGTIQMWFSQQGQICPLTGAPLVEADLKPQPELQQQIMQWTLRRGQGRVEELSEEPAAPAEAAPRVVESAGSKATPAPAGDNDLYDF